MNYEEMSDFEINKLVATSKGIDIPVIDGVFNIIDGNVAVSTDPNGGLNRKRLFSDYCNNPSEAWPIIVDNKIGITHGSQGCSALTVTNNELIQITCNSNELLRAAMICFLKIRGSGNR